ncbi:diaminopimelate decarboxylase [Tissierella sp. MSJ-40]|uniref:Diaminopimelate decarboxylase n=1 Tax=Tissierella simiarum TaxID=2841534 RepID=A0ABS6E9W3_9FIRM|nr:diaminopimelate decarboxylase [Tissierella simiarum]MBU5439549.1 diaminopimelate decarboxylase [Tissierella simiarum]
MDQYDRSFYIYDESIISRQVKILLDNFPQFEFLYSVKTNPFAPIIHFAALKGFGTDAASVEEVIISQKAGLSYEKIFYSTPGKTRRDIEKTIDKAIIVADSYNELLLLNDIAEQKNMNIKVGLRINIDFAMDSGSCLSSKFGVDENTLVKQKDFLNSLSNIKIVGIHVHLRSQVLDHSRLYQYYERIFELALFCKEILGWEMEFINFGGGLGIVYSLANDAPLDVEKLSNECEGLIRRFKDKINARLIIETGRFIICEAGQYVTRIVDIKESMGIKYLIVEKGLNGFLRPSIAELLMDYIPEDSNLKASEPLFTVKDAFEFMIPEGERSVFEKVTIVGSLCTATDIMVKDVVLPKAHIGDIVIVSKAGSYSYSLSPILFSSHSLPFQFYLKTDGEICMK